MQTVIIGMAAMCLMPATMPAQTDAIILDHVDHAPYPGLIRANAPVTFYFRYTVRPDEGKVMAFSIGHRVYSPDGIEWTPVEIDTILPGIADSFDVAVDLIGSSVTGEGADTVSLIGMSAAGPGFSPGFDGLVESIGVQVTGPYLGMRLCIDSSYNPQAGEWRFAKTTGVSYPVWDGPHCYLVAACCVGMRGDVNFDPQDQVNIADVTYLVDYVFLGGPEPQCREEADFIDDPLNTPTVEELTWLVAYLFQGGDPPSLCPVIWRAVGSACLSGP